MYITEQRETCIDMIEGNEYCTVYTSKKKYMNKMMELAEDYPDDVKILQSGEDGILAHVPARWFRFIHPIKKRALSDEQRQRMSDHMKSVRQASKQTS